MASLQEFLKHVLPGDGAKCWVAISKSKPRSIVRQGFVQGIDALAAALTAIDQRQSDAYFACASFKSASYLTPKGEDKPRVQENALGARAFWLDIDAGPGKPYADVDAAISAVDYFAEQVGLPVPMIVESGNGVHAWWALDTMLPADIWLRGAAALKALCKSLDLYADPTRTADISSILRPLGTHNWKDPANPKLVLGPEHLEPRVPARDFLMALSSMSGPAPVPMPVAAGPDIAGAAMNITRPTEPSYGAIAVQHCRQLQIFRDTGGNIPEPVWYAGLCVLAHCADGDKLGHEWSSGHPEYSPDDTQAKLEHGRADSGPTTCVRFQDLSPEGCKGCPHNVTSPIVLGRGQTISAPAAPVPQKESMPELPFGFKWGQGMQLLALVKGEDDKLKSITVSQHAIYLSALRVSENREDAYGYVFQQWFPHASKWVQFELTAEETLGIGFRSALGKHGVHIGHKEHAMFVTYVERARTMLRAQKDEDKRYDQFGWKADRCGFLLGNVLYTHEGLRKLAAGVREVEQRSKMMMPVKGGSLDGWRQHIQRMFVPGVEGQSFAVLCAFAAPIMQFLMGEEGGAILSLVTPEGGRGKTTVLSAIASVYGQLDGFRILGMDTPIAKFRSISVLRNLPVVYDEFLARDPMASVDFVRSFTTGRDKKRAKRDGSIDHVENDWQTILITTSNQSLIDHIIATGIEPQAARIFEVELQLPPGMRGDMVKELYENLMANRGYAGVAFIEQLVRDGTQDWLQQVLPQLVSHYADVTKGTTEHRFILRLLACVAAAAHIVNQAGILKFDIDRVMTWAIQRAKERIKDKTTFDPALAVKSIINANSFDCLVVNDRYRTGQPCIVRQPLPKMIRMRYEIKPQRLYIPAEYARKWLTENHKPVGAVGKGAEELGVLLSRTAMRSLGAGTEYVTAQVPCWEFDMSHPLMSGEVRLADEAATAVANDA